VPWCGYIFFVKNVLQPFIKHFISSHPPNGGWPIRQQLEIPMPDPKKIPPVKAGF
jgi:hypothetical protein